MPLTGTKCHCISVAGTLTVFRVFIFKKFHISYDVFFKKGCSLTSWFSKGPAVENIKSIWYTEEKLSTKISSFNGFHFSLITMLILSKVCNGFPCETIITEQFIKATSNEKHSGEWSLNVLGCALRKHCTAIFVIYNYISSNETYFPWLISSCYIKDHEVSNLNTMISKSPPRVIPGSASFRKNSISVFENDHLGNSKLIAPSVIMEGTYFDKTLRCWWILIWWIS